ncbi:hypothetical protein C8R47DRAFT_724584 [Mycena vitilis]|nr:hypothetical protein C8R47DRAFT_724584 [Mycena vitilis]
MYRVPWMFVRCVSGRRRAAAPSASTGYIASPRPAFQSRNSRRRQAHGAFKFKRPDCGVAGVQCVVEEPRSGAECLDTAYQLPASGSLALKFWPPAGRARCASKPTSQIFSSRVSIAPGKCCLRRRMLRRNISRSRELPLSAELLAAGRHPAPTSSMSRGGAAKRRPLLRHDGSRPRKLPFDAGTRRLQSQ